LAERPTLVPEGAVHDLLGIRRAPRQHGINIMIVNWNQRRLLDREDVLRWFRANASHLDLPILHRLADELAEVTAPMT